MYVLYEVIQCTNKYKNRINNNKKHVFFHNIDICTAIILWFYDFNNNQLNDIKTDNYDNIKNPIQIK